MKNNEKEVQKQEEIRANKQMSKAQETYLKQLTIKTGKEADAQLSRKEASKKIERLQKEVRNKEKEE